MITDLGKNMAYLVPYIKSQVEERERVLAWGSALIRIGGWGLGFHYVLVNFKLKGRNLRHWKGKNK